MLKIHKGLKKKKKDKKNKRKEDELFNEEELEKYRKEHSKPVASGDAHLAQPSNSSEQSDEWQKFKALTAGVDTILQKTQEDLDRIKSTSFFQRKAPASEVEKQKEEEERAADGQDGKANQEDDEQRADQQRQSDRALGLHDKSESEEESEELEVDDTLFDTSYVDAVASGELKLAYIPDSPPDQEDDYDPFDTSYASKYIESNPKKRYLNLGCAVQVLSGRPSVGNVELKSPCVSIERKSPRRRPKPVDLLLTSFDEGVDANSAAVERTPVDSPVKTLLDEDPLFVADDDLAIAPLAVTPLPLPPAPPASTPVGAVDKKHQKLDLSDFEINELDVAVSAGILNLNKQPSSESTDDEFARLAAESLARKSSSAQPTPNDPTAKPLHSSLDVVTPTAEFIAVDPLRPAPATVAPVQLEEIDPFDTSIVAKVILPGKQEIRLLEQELLSDIASVRKAEPTSADLDDDFDPRAGESSPPKAIRPQELLIERKARAEKIVSPSKKPDLLKIEEVDAHVQVAKPLTPLAVADQDRDRPLDQEYDPFDTSHICGAPGKLELKLIENELTDNSRVQDDDDFDPRKYESVDCPRSVTASITHRILDKYSCNPEASQQQQERKIEVDILTGTANEDEQDAFRTFSTPVEPKKYVTESADIAYSDPFDTSIADNIQPGKVELKLLETELISKN